MPRISPPLPQPDRPAVSAFVGAIFKHADPETFISLRGFHDLKDNQPALFVEGVKVGAPDLIDRACCRIIEAASHPEPHVFCPPVCTFKAASGATGEDLAEGVTLAADCDEHPQAALAKLTAILGPPTVIVASGGIWLNGGKPEAKLHMHWRLTKPTSTPEQHDRLREARDLAAQLVGADKTAIAINHPLRWPGSWHRKHKPQIARVKVSETEIDLDVALDLLRDAVGLQEHERAGAGGERHGGDRRHQHGQRADDLTVEDAIAIVPNPDLPWDDWNRIGMALWSATNGQGFTAFDSWSRQSGKYNPKATQDRWRHYSTSPPSRIGAGTIFFEADRAAPGWRRRSKDRDRREQSHTQQAPREPDSIELVMLEASKVKMVPVRWLWNERIAIGKLCLLAGEPGLAKSQVTLWLAAAVTTGGPLPSGGMAPTGNVIILSAEDTPEDTIVPRLKAVGADLSRIRIITMVRETKAGVAGQRSFDLQLDLPALERAVADLGDVRLIIIDPIASYMGKRVDSHKNSEVRAVLEPVASFAAKHGMTILGVTHFSKGAGPTAINKFIGSIAFIAAARSAFVVTMDPDSEDKDRRLFLPVKNNLARLGTGLAFRVEQIMLDGTDIPASHVRWLDEVIERDANAVLAVLGERHDHAIREAEDFLDGFLSSGRQKVTAIRDAARGHGHAWRTVERAKHDLGIISINAPEAAAEDGVPPKPCWYWERPAGVP